MSNLDDGHYGQETLNYEDMNDDHFFEDMGFSLDDLAMLLTPRDGAPSTLTSPFLVSPQGSAAQKQKKTKTFTFDEVDDNKNSTFTPYLKVHQQQTKLDTGLAATTLQIPIDVDDKSIAMGPPQAFYSAANNNSYSNYHPIPTLNSSNTSTNNTVSSHTELSGTAINGYVPQPAGETRGKKNSLKKMEQIAAPMPYQSNFAQIYSNTAWENTDMKLPSLASKNFAMNSDSSAYYQDASLILNNYGNFSNNSANIGSNYRNQIDDASMDNSALPFDQLSGKSYTEGSGKSSLMDFEFDSSGPIEHRMYHLNSQGSEALVEYDITESMKDKIEKNRVSSELFNGDSGKGIVENPPGNEIVKQEQSLDAVKDELSRASKSLAAISRRFVEHYGDKDTIKYLSGGIDCDEPPGVDDSNIAHRVDGAAASLGVHVRRIYEVIKILEILSLINFTGGKRGKFVWNGTKDFLFTIGRIQSDAIKRYSDIAESSGVNLTVKDGKLVRIPAKVVVDTGSSGMTVSGTALEVPGHLPPRSTHSNMLLINITNAKSKSPSVSRDPSPCNSKGADSLCISNVASSYYDSSDVGSPSSEISTPRLGETTSHHDPIAISILCCDSEPENMDTDIGSPQLAITGKKSNIYAEGGIIKSSNLSPTNKVSTNNSPLLIGMYSDAVESKDKSQTRKRNKAAMSPKNSLTISTGADAEEFMVESICKHFLQLFLAGYDGIALNYAIHKLIPLQEGQTLEEYNKKNATKIRRVYDVANVLCSLNLLVKKARNTPGLIAGKTAIKTDNKALFWSSFSILTIREKYLEKQQKLGLYK